jgi:hypothetical protein
MLYPSFAGDDTMQNAAVESWLTETTKLKKVEEKSVRPASKVTTLLVLGASERETDEVARVRDFVAAGSTATNLAGFIRSRFAAKRLILPRIGDCSSAYRIPEKGGGQYRISSYWPA